MLSDTNNPVSANINFEILFYEGLQPMWIFDSGTRKFLEVNQAAITMYGYSREEFLLMSLPDIWPVEDLGDQKFKPGESNQNYTIESEHIYKNRKRVEVEIMIFPFYFKGKAARLAFVKDISERKKREAHLVFLNKASEDLALSFEVTTALKNVSALIVPKFTNWFTVNLLEGEQLKLLYVSNENPDYIAWAIDHRIKNPVTISDTGVQGHILRTGESSLIPYVTDEMLDELVTDKELLRVIKPMNLRSSISVPMIVKNKIIGTVSFISTIDEKIYDELDLVFAKDFAIRIGLVLENARIHEQSMTEIEERKKAENKKDEFIGVASHELKTPLTTLSATLQMLDRIYKNDPESRKIPELLRSGNKSVAKLNQLVSQLLDVSKVEVGQLKLHKSTVNLSDIISDSCHFIELISEHDIQIKGEQNLEVLCDSQRIEQVVLNFLNNAIKYSPDSKTIEICVEKINGFVKVSVTDFGIGIDPEKLKHIFDRYYRVDYSGIQYSGLGLGLYISAEIIRLHKGTIGVDSEPGKGSMFWFKLPIV